MSYTVAAIDVHKQVLMVVAATGAAQVEDPANEPLEFESRRFGTGHAERQHLVSWLKQHNVMEVVMESTALYWKSIWLDLESHFPKLHLAQAHSNKAPRGRKDDFRDAKRLARRLVAGELLLSFVPDPEQRMWRTLTRSKYQLIRDRVRLQNQMECLLEEMRIKLSVVISDLLGLSGRRILAALAEGETDPQKLASYGDRRLQCSQEELTDALTGNPELLQREVLKLFLKRLQVLDEQIEHLDKLAATALKKHEDALVRVAQIPGFGPDSAQQLIAEIGHDAASFPSAGEFSSWVAICPGSNITAEKNHSSRSAKGNRFVRRLLSQAANAAVRRNGCFLHLLYRRHLPTLSHNGAVSVVAHRLARIVWKILHAGVRYIEMGTEGSPQAKQQRTKRLVRALRKLGYDVTLVPKTTDPAPAPAS